MNYTIVESQTAFDLNEQVNDLIHEGWRPIGGVCVANSNANPQLWWFYQAMVKGRAEE